MIQFVDKPGAWCQAWGCTGACRSGAAQKDVNVVLSPLEGGVLCSEALWLQGRAFLLLQAFPYFFFYFYFLFSFLFAVEE